MESVMLNAQLWRLMNYLLVSAHMMWLSCVMKSFPLFLPPSHPPSLSPSTVLVIQGLMKWVSLNYVAVEGLEGVVDLESKLSTTHWVYFILILLYSDTNEHMLHPLIFPYSLSPSLPPSSVPPHDHLRRWWSECHSVLSLEGLEGVYYPVSSIYPYFIHSFCHTLNHI